MKRQYQKIIAFYFTAMIVFSGCSKLIEVDPPVAYINSENVFLENGTAIAAVTGMYVTLVNNFTGTAVANISYRAALSADELHLFSGVTNASLIAYYKNQLVSSAALSVGGELWPRLYNMVFASNAAIEGLTSANKLSTHVKQQLLGEVFFLRAFAYFYLVNMYGDVPLVLTSDPSVAVSTPRTSTATVYQQIKKDLIQARELLSPAYPNKDLLISTTDVDRVRPNKWAASALLARAYLYTGDDKSAEIESSKVISQTVLYDTVPLNSVFLKGDNKEVIWQLQPVRADRNSEDAFLFQLPATGPNATSNPVYLSNSQLASFEPGDQRAVLGNWINSVTVGSNTYYFAFKYKLTAGSVEEYPVVLRIAEQYLIRAEARARLGKLTGTDGAAADLNIIRTRAGLPSISVSTEEQMIADIQKERRSELFLEWGHRWFDIKRSGQIATIMNAAAFEKGSAWQDYQKLYPLQFSEIQRSAVLVQNPGY